MPEEKLAPIVRTGENNDGEINWLEHWERKRVRFKFDPHDNRPMEDQVNEKKRMLESYVRGWLQMYNDEKKTNYVVRDFDIRRVANSADVYIVKAYLNPPPTDSGNSGPGSHLIPPEPPPAGDQFG